MALPIRSYLTLRSLGFLAEFKALSGLANLIPGSKPASADWDPDTLQALLDDIQVLFQKDAENIIGGLYPMDVLKPEPASKHLRRLPGLLWDGIKINRRRRQKKSKEFDQKSTALLQEMPDYYRRNFHFQSGGYLSEKSAELYEHQVELLFLGAADSMRRLCIAPLKTRLNSPDGQGLHLLELACGTGRTTRFLRLAFPKAKITAIDLSPTYLKTAQKHLLDLPRIDFMEADASKLPFKNETFDAVVSVYLFHEIPKEVRRDVMSESLRVLKAGGWSVTVDSIQIGDQPKFDGLLGRFPVDFHEPFYKNYTEDSLRELYLESKFEVYDEDRGFLSKMLAARKA